MDPTVEVLTIYPAAWAALFQGLAEGLVLGLVGMAAAALLATVLMVCLGNLTNRGEEAPAHATFADLGEPPADERPAIVQLAVVRRQRQLAGRA